MPLHGYTKIYGKSGKLNGPFRGADQSNLSPHLTCGVKVPHVTETNIGLAILTVWVCLMLQMRSELFSPTHVHDTHCRSAAQREQHSCQLGAVVLL